MKILIFLFLITLQLCLILLIVVTPTKNYLSLTRIKNLWTNKLEYNLFPDLVLYNKDQTKNIYKSIEKNKETVIIVQGCSCKDADLNKWISEAKKSNIPLIYIYTSEKDFYNDKLALKNQNVFVYLCSSVDILSFFKKEDVVDFPIAYTVDNSGIIISKER